MAHELQSFNRNLFLIYCFLNALLVALEEIGARVPGAVSFEELLSKPAIEALVVLALHVGACLPDAVHGYGGGDKAHSDVITLRRVARHFVWPHYGGRKGKKCAHGRCGWLFGPRWAGAGASPARRILR